MDPISDPENDNADVVERLGEETFRRVVDDLLREQGTLGPRCSECGVDDDDAEHA